MATVTQTKSLLLRLYDGAVTLNNGLLEDHNDVAKESEDFRYACPECGKLELEDDPEDDEDACCQACYDTSHVTCKRCGDKFFDFDMSLDYPHLCDSCADEHRDEQIEGLQYEISDLLESWEDENKELTINRLKKVLAYAKRQK